MQAEIISIGTELLLGAIVDTNAAYIARQLASIGLNLFYKTTVGDNAERIAYVIRQAMERSDVIITTGGLGPTVDDVTREGVAMAVGRPLQEHPEAMRHIEEFFRRRGRQPSKNNWRQARIPAEATVIPNPVGTAPAFIVEHEGKIIISLPGVPREMEYLMQHVVLPFLRERLHTGDTVIKSKVLRTCAIGESNVDDLIGDLMRSENPTVGLAAHVGQTDIRITAKAHSQAEADRLIADMEARVRARVGDYIYGTDDELLEEVVARELAARGAQVSILETNTAGEITRRLRAAPDGAKVIRASAVVPDDLPTLRAMGIELSPGDEHTFTPEEAAEVALTWRGQTGAAYGLVILGSQGESEGLYGERPGHTHIALADESGRVVHRDLGFGGREDLARAWIGNHALDLLRRALLGLPER
ncbi:MAG: CinA family nicotinamide mononucleotide deamidase-related protein [Anaerolineae bacterium]|nr:CinA family nicotinamide mononucleotide deamidase-related protein [Anaerolineae bacterium]